MFTNLRKTQRAYLSLSNALERLQAEAEQQTIYAAIKRGYFLPKEDDHLWSLVSRYLTIRSGFWEIINDMSAHFSDDIGNVKNLDDWRHFLLGYASSCQAVHMARMMIDDVAQHKLVQRKLNEGAPQHRIPRKVFTHIYESLSDADNAIKMQYMMNFVDDNRSYIRTLNADNYVSEIVQNLTQLEATLHPSQLAFIKLRLRYLWHAITRRGASSKQHTSFFILEKAGRVISEIADHRSKRVTPEICSQLAHILKPGDVIITRHDLVASNLFLPGYWPHSALYIGSEEERDALGIKLDDAIKKRWSGKIRTLEAQKDGVLFRPLNETLKVDELVIIRPDLNSSELAEGLERVCQHEGKGYNFDFDFFSSNRLVCTEVIYRAFDGLGNIQFKLIERAGRLSLSAEDILDMAVNEQGFKMVCIVGYDGGTTIETGEAALGLLNLDSSVDRFK
jgi:hypothetical protein